MPISKQKEKDQTLIAGTVLTGLLIAMGILCIFLSGSYHLIFLLIIGIVLIGIGWLLGIGSGYAYGKDGD